jgi:hypothetical protein
MSQKIARLAGAVIAAVLLVFGGMAMSNGSAFAGSHFHLQSLRSQPSTSNPAGPYGNTYSESSYQDGDGDYGDGDGDYGDGDYGDGDGDYGDGDYGDGDYGDGDNGDGGYW